VTLRRSRQAAALTAAAVLWAAAVLGASLTPEARDRVIKEAHRLEVSGDRQAAIVKLQALYEEAPLDGVVVETLADMLSSAGETEKATEILARYTAERGDDTRAMSTLATLYFRAGKKDKGLQAIERIVDRARDQLWPYQVALDAMTGSGLNEETIDLVRQARSATGDSIAFAVEAARIFSDTGKPGAAAREYLRAGLARNMSSEIATEYIVDMAADAAARPAVVAALNRAAGIPAFARTVTRSLAEIYIMDEDCSVALDMISRLVDMDPSSANVLVGFARKASASGCFVEAARAYELVLAHVDSGDKAAGYLLEKGRCEASAGLDDEALATFEKVASDYRAHKAADEALMGRALIFRERGDPASAIAEADRMMESKYKDNVIRGVLFKADCQVASGDLDRAFETYDEVRSDWTAAYAQEAYFNMAEISLYRGRLDDARSYYNVTLREYPDQARANDALDRLLLMKACGAAGPDSTNLVDYAGALLLRRQGDEPDAARILAGLGGGEEVELPLRVESLRELAGIYVEEGDLEKAVGTYRLIGDSLDTPEAASAIESVGDIYLDSGWTGEAIKAYEDVILRFPRSVSAGDARRKIDMANRGRNDEN
jgi:tetratricopeptide (TPR) repeat protein